MARYSKKERETAALICAIGASTPDLNQSYGEVCKALGIAEDCPASDLALDAWSHALAARLHLHDGDDSAVDAEAAAMIADGWSPS